MRLGSAQIPEGACDRGLAARARLSKCKRERLDRELLEAVSTHQEGKLGRLLDLGASVEARYESGTPIAGLTAAMVCAAKLGENGFYHGEDQPNYERILRVCDPSAVDNQGMTALMHAASEGCMRAVHILAPRSDLLAVCGDMGEDFDGSWPALFFALNMAHVAEGDPKKAERLAWHEEMFGKLACDEVWSVRSREGRDARAVVERLVRCESILDLLDALKARREAAAIEKDLASGAGRRAAHRASNRRSSL